METQKFYFIFKKGQDRILTCVEVLKSVVDDTLYKEFGQRFA